MGIARNLLNGRNDLLSVLLRVALLPLQLLYLVVVNAKNSFYDTGLIKAGKADVPVVSIGNLTVGGTGKTPLVIALAQRGLAAGKKVAVVTRGYGAAASPDGLGDEAALIRDRAEGVELIVTTDKLGGAREAAARGADVVLVDDGLQHRRLHRDLDIICVDARAPFGNGEVLPCGPLREPASGLGRAGLVVLSHSEMMSEEHLEVITAHLGAHNRGVRIVRAEHAPLGVRPVTGGELAATDTLAGVDVHLFCGVAAPESFQHTIESLGAQVTGMTAFGDHHDFTPADIAKVRAEAGTSLLVCTEKDAGKIASIPGQDDVLCLVIEMSLFGELPPLPGLDD